MDNIKKAPFSSCMAAISLSSCCTGNVHIGRTNQGGVGDVYAPVAWGMVLRRKWSSIHYIVGVERNRFSIHQWRNRMLIFCSTSTFSKTCNKIEKQLLKLLDISPTRFLILILRKWAGTWDVFNSACQSFIQIETAVSHCGLRSFQGKELQPSKPQG